MSSTGSEVEASPSPTLEPTTSCSTSQAVSFSLPQRSMTEEERNMTSLSFYDKFFKMSPPDIYSVESQLTPLGRQILREYGLVEAGEAPEDAFGRSIRLSLLYRIAIASSIELCIKLISKKPQPYDDLMQVLGRFSRIQRIGNASATADGFPFARLPTEIQEMILKISVKSQNLIHVPYCDHCTYDDSRIARNTANMAIFQVSSEIRAMAQALYFDQNIFGFLCTCAIVEFFRLHGEAANKVRNVVFCWEGSHRRLAIKKLGGLSGLDFLGIGVTRGTVSVPSDREALVRRHFGGRKRQPPIRIPDALGFNELMKLKNLTHVFFEPDGYLRSNDRLRNEFAGLQEFFEKTKPIVKPDPVDPYADREDTASLDGEGYEDEEDQGSPSSLSNGDIIYSSDSEDEKKYVMSPSNSKTSSLTLRAPTAADRHPLNNRALCAGSLMYETKMYLLNKK